MAIVSSAIVGMRSSLLGGFDVKEFYVLLLKLSHVLLSILCCRLRRGEARMSNPCERLDMVDICYHKPFEGNDRMLFLGHNKANQVDSICLKAVRSAQVIPIQEAEILHGYWY